MIVITSSSKPKAGGIFCAEVAGFQGNLTARATVDGVEVPVRLHVEKGVAEVCVRLDDSTIGKELIIRVSDSKGNDAAFSRLIRK
ncbi:MAG: hypothetical protein H6807_04910 [Planctomycetes bacterium]|nr:hypothetical protein [Planctomycetota bacterium]